MCQRHDSLILKFNSYPLIYVSKEIKSFKQLLCGTIILVETNGNFWQHLCSDTLIMKFLLSIHNDRYLLI